MLRQCTFLYAAHVRISRCFFGVVGINHGVCNNGVVVVVVLFYFAYQTHCFFVVVIAVAVMAV